MKKLSYYHFVIAAGTILLVASLHHYHTNEVSKQREVASPFSYVKSGYETSASQNNAILNVAAPIPTKAITALDDLSIRNTSISLGNSAEEVIQKLGQPSRIAATEYGFDYYIYNTDYHHMVFIAVKDEKVVGFYTDSEDFSFHNINYGSTLKKVNTALQKNYEDVAVITYSSSSYNAQILFDTLDTKTVVGIYVLSKDIKKASYTKDVMKNIDQIIYDLINSMRVRNGIAALSWSSSAAKAAKKHSISMAGNGYFSHTDLQRRSPGGRLYAEGISFIKCNENITAGYDSAILSCHNQYISLKQRNNILNRQFRYIGIGFIYDKDSIYKTYITQSFYR